MENLGTPARTAGAHCCICKQGIEFEINADNVAINPGGFDPCGLGFVTNVFGPRNGQREQWFYCHAECFRKLVGAESSLCILEPGFETIEECNQAEEQDILEAASSTWEAL